MTDIIFFTICLLLIVAIHIIEELHFVKFITLNRAIIADCVIVIIYLLIFTFMM